MPPPVGLLSAAKEFVNDAVGDVVATGEVRLDWSACPATCPSLLGCEVSSSSSDPLAPNIYYIYIYIYNVLGSGGSEIPVRVVYGG